MNCPWGSLTFFTSRKRLEEIVSSTSLQLDPFFWAFNNFKMWYIISPCSVLYKKIVHLSWILHYFLSWYESQNHMSSFGLCVKLFIGFLFFLCARIFCEKVCSWWYIIILVASVCFHCDFPNVSSNRLAEQMRCFKVTFFTFISDTNMLSLCPEFLCLLRFCFEFALYSHWLQYQLFMCDFLWCPSFEFDVALWSHWSQPNTSYELWVLSFKPIWLVLKSHSSQWYHKSWWVLLMCDSNMGRWFPS